MVLPAHALQAVQVTLKLASNEGHFTLEAETVFRPYLPYDSSGVTEEYHMVLPAHVLQAEQLRMKSVSNEEHFTLEVKKVLHPYLTQDCSGVTQ
jgi:hypothetical protein